MKLADARLCMDCEWVFEGSACPKCGSNAWAQLIHWLDR